jgi:hypothetical protein
MQPKFTSLLRLLPFLLSAFRVTAQAQDAEAIWQQVCAAHLRGLTHSRLSLQITPTSNLTWTPCYTDDLQCARYLVPLDYQHPTGPQAAIALLKAPSSLSPDDKAYRGPILLNPGMSSAHERYRTSLTIILGGPGGSGVDFVLDMGALARQVLGPEYDIIGFDPRSVDSLTDTL